MKIMTQNKIFLICFTAILFLSCSKNRNYKIIYVDGVKKVINKSKPINKDLKLFLTKNFTLNFNTEKTANINRPISFDIDDKNNIYIMDMKGFAVKKFDCKGKFIKSICGFGQGPGEVNSSNAMCIISDTIMIYSKRMNKLLKYSTSGKFISEKKYAKFLPSLFKRYKNKLVGLKNTTSADNKKTFFNLVSYDIMTNQEQIIAKNQLFRKNNKINLFDLYFPYGISKNKLFVSNLSNSVYQISVFDEAGKLEYQFSKPYTSIKFKKDEMKLSYASYNLKKAVNYIIPENDKRVYVFASIKRNKKNNNLVNIDIFENGVYIGKVLTNKLIAQDFNYENLSYKIKNGLLYQFSLDNNTLDVFDIILK